MSDVVETVLEAVADTAPEIREGLVGRREYQEGKNPSGEEQLAADVHADQLLEERLLNIEGIGSYASEEREEIVGDESGLSVAADPLDGSSNLKSNNSMGTIVAVYDAPLPARGRDLLAAAYVLFGPITTMMSAVDGTVSEYVIEDSEARSVRESQSDSRSPSEARSASEDASDQSSGRSPRDGERHTVTETVSLPEDPTVYGFGGRVPDWTDGFTDYAREIEHELKLRYSGAMIGDVNQVLTYGGVFAYPALESASEGKLRLQFEGNPIAYLVESAGGRSSDGEQSLLDVEPDELHGRVPVHVGNPELIEQLETTLRTDENE